MNGTIYVAGGGDMYHYVQSFVYYKSADKWVFLYTPLFDNIYIVPLCMEQIHGVLYLGGGFNGLLGNIPITANARSFVYAYENGVWSDMNIPSEQYQAVKAMIHMNGSLIVGGGYSLGGSAFVYSLKNGVWRDLSFQYEQSYGAIQALAVGNGILYAAGGGRNFSLPFVYSWDGTTWTNISQASPYFDIDAAIYSMIFVDGTLYVAGGLLAGRNGFLYSYTNGVWASTWYSSKNALFSLVDYVTSQTYAIPIVQSLTQLEIDKCCAKSTRSRVTTPQTELDRILRNVTSCTTYGIPKPLYSNNFSTDCGVTLPMYKKSNSNTNTIYSYPSWSIPRINGIDQLVTTFRTNTSSVTTSRKKDAIIAANTSFLNQRARKLPPPPPCVAPIQGPQPGVPIAPNPPCILGNQRVDYSVAN